MRKLLFIKIFICTFIYTKSQNLVPNHSFEQYDTCPYSASQILFAAPWFQPNISAGSVINSGSTDYYNICDTTSIWGGVPDNFPGYQYAKTGVAYAGINVSFNNGQSNGREYLEIKLNDSLINGRKYCAQFYISLADTCQNAIDAIGIYFSLDSLLYNGSTYQYIPAIPQVSNTQGNIISAKENWTLISGEFIANGGETFITIGNFFPDSLTNADTTGLAYYYIDDVSVYLCDCDTTPPVAKFNLTSDTLTVTFNNLSSAYSNYWLWDFGDGNTDTTFNPVHTYDSAGVYTVTLVAWYNGCNDTLVASITVNDVGIKTSNLENNIFISRMYPNPNEGIMQLNYVLEAKQVGTLEIFDLSGKSLQQYSLETNSNTLKIYATNLSAGIYFYRIKINDEIPFNEKLIIIK